MAYGQPVKYTVFCNVCFSHAANATVYVDDRKYRLCIPGLLVPVRPGKRNCFVDH